MNVSDQKVPDLLKRFTRTPHSAHFRVNKTDVRLETNDPAIIAAAARFESLPDHRTEDTPVLWKLIRENEESPAGEFSVLVTADLILLRRGNATLITVDIDRREALGFLAPDVDARELGAVIYPFLAGWCGAGVDPVRPES